MLLYSENLHDDRGPDAFDNDAYNSEVVYLGGHWPLVQARRWMVIVVYLEATPPLR